MRLAVPDMISNSYFPAIAAIELGLFMDVPYDAIVAHRLLSAARRP